MKRMMWSAVLATALAATVAIPVIAQPPQGMPPQGTRGPGRGPGPEGPLPLLRGLNLTDAQREQIRVISEAQRTADNPRRNLMDLERQLQVAIFSDAPDQQKIDDLKNSIAAAGAAELTARIDLESRIAQVLTPEQRAQARDALAQSSRPPRWTARCRPPRALERWLAPFLERCQPPFHGSVAFFEGFREFARSCAPFSAGGATGVERVMYAMCGDLCGGNDADCVRGGRACRETASHRQPLARSGCSD